MQNQKFKKNNNLIIINLIKSKNNNNLIIILDALYISKIYRQLIMGYDVFEILSPDRYMTEVEAPLPSSRNKSGHAPPFLN
jgi:hypothetical protein